MTDQEIINIAREAGYGWSMADMHFTALQRFANLVAAKEREDCALLCDDIAMTHDVDGYPSGAAIADECASAIRARGEI